MVMKAGLPSSVFLLIFLGYLVLAFSCEIWGPYDNPYDLRNVPGTIGNTGPAGGIIFCDKGHYSNGWRYLEAWTADESGSYQWKTSTTLTSGTATGIGTGAANTRAMAGAEHPAAQAARNARYGGYSDWFLPSQDELNLMYQRKANIGGFAFDDYWSSSDNNSYNAWTQYFGNGYQYDGSKGYDRRVRVVRAY
jgi:hypothetical protein